MKILRTVASKPSTHFTHIDKTKIEYPSYGQDAAARALHEKEAGIWQNAGKAVADKNSLEYLVAVAMYNWHKSQQYLSDEKPGAVGTYMKFSDQFDKARFKVNRYKPR